MIEAHFGELEAVTSTSAACDLLGVSRATPLCQNGGCRS